MTKQVTTTYAVTIRSLWHTGDHEDALPGQFPVMDEENNLVALFLTPNDAESCCTDHNRTTRQRAKQREHRKADAKSAHQDHSEDTDPDGETEETREDPKRLANEKLQQQENKARRVKGSK